MTARPGKSIILMSYNACREGLPTSSDRDLYRAVNAHGLNLDQIYREINVTNFGCIIAYLAFVCLQNDSEESIRHNVQKTIEACQIFTIPKHKPSH